MPHSLESLATPVTTDELKSIEKHFETPHDTPKINRELAKSAIPPVLEWGPAHLRDGEQPSDDRVLGSYNL